MKKALKGNYGYIKAKRNRVIIRTIIFFAISLAIFVAGYITTGTRKNLFTIVAVLGCLPACKSLVNIDYVPTGQGMQLKRHGNHKAFRRTSYRYV